MNTGADNLPTEVLVKIFSYLSYEDLVGSVQFVCTWWQQVSWEKRLWSYIMYEACTTSKQVIRMLKISPQLKALNLVSATVDNNLIQYINDSCPNLEHLHLFWDSIYNYAEVTITHPMNQIKKLSLVCEEELDMDFSYLDKTFPNLQDLNVAVLKYNRKDFMAYLKKKHDSLHTLSISCCTDDNLCVLPCLSVCTKLRKLCLYSVCDEVQRLSCKEVKCFQNISQLALHNSNMSDSLSIFCSFPNITELELYGCTEANEDIFHIIARNCPQIEKLKLPYHYQWHGDSPLPRDTTLKYALELERLRYLSIHGNSFVTDEGVKHLQLIPELIHLDLYQCELVTTACLKLICGFSKLKVLKFDLRNKPLPADLKASDVKNKSLQLMFYNCRDVSSLDSLRQQHLRVCLIGSSPWWNEH